MTMFLLSFWNSTTHLVPSKANLGGLVTAVLAPAAPALGAAAGAAVAGTTDDLFGLFFDFISLVTFFKPEVTPSPLDRAAKTLFISPPAGLPDDGAGAPVGAGGGGGPEGAEGAEEVEAVAEPASPPLGFHETPVV